MSYTINFTGVEVGTTPASITFDSEYIILNGSYFNLPDVDELNRFSGWTNLNTGSFLREGEKIFATDSIITLEARYNPDPDPIDTVALIFQGTPTTYIAVAGTYIDTDINNNYISAPFSVDGYDGWRSNKTGSLYFPGQTIRYDEWAYDGNDVIFIPANETEKVNYYKTADGWKPIRYLYKKTENGWQLAKSISQKTEGGWR